jgi:dipeptidyl aminopeptidase/acylaminoacyl peptidase
MDRFACLCVIVALAALPAVVFAEGRRPLTLDDLFRFQRVNDPQISPDGKLVVYVRTTVDLAANKSTSALWLAPADGKGEPRALTNPGQHKRDRHPRWAPDGKHILFESNRAGDDQLWGIDLRGGEARQLTTLSTGAGNALWSRDGKQIAFVSTVFPEYSEKPFKESDALNKQRKDDAEKNPVKARVFTRLFFRHWDSYVEDKRQHLFLISFNDGQGGEPKDVTPGDRDAFPTSDTFATGDNFTFSPDGKYLVFTAVPEKDEAWSTNYELCRVPVTGGGKDWECLTKANPAADSGPVFSPDGTKLAYRAQKRAGFEADRWELLVVDTDASGAFKGEPRSVTSQFDGSPEGPVWAADNLTLLFTADKEAANPIFAVRPGKLDVWQVLGDGACSALSISADGKYLAFVRASMSQPAEVFVQSGGFADRAELGRAANVSRANDQLLAELDLPRPESVSVPVGDRNMQMWILKPPGFDATKKWPLAYLVHGGPQGAWEDGWSYRWNPELWAAQGYVVALPNPRGSTGFGQAFVDAISGDWGGKCYDDLTKGVDYLERLPYIDKERMAAAGASFGGYMVNWFAVSTGRFKCLVSHCGVWNFDSMYATTEELWFDEWEHGGPPWGKDRASYEKYSPHRRAANLEKFKTPVLIIQNDLDFRVPVSEGQQFFTTLRRLGIPSRFINFPDEGHWVLKPANSAYWHREVFGWLKKYVPPGGR